MARAINFNQCFQNSIFNFCYLYTYNYNYNCNIYIYIYMNNDLFDKSIIDLIFVYIQVDAPLPQ